MVLSLLLQPFRKRWKKISIAGKLYSVVGIMAALIIIELLVLHFAMETLLAVRAFVGGEGTWTKSQKNAIYNLELYATTKDESDYLAFQKALDIPRADRRARLELEKPNPNLDIVKESFVVGKIHPDDVNAMVTLLLRFNQISYIAEALNSWREADALILDLEKVAEEYRQLMLRPNVDPAEIKVVAKKIGALNNTLSTAEENFSEVLGEGSRWLERLLNLVLICMVITVESIGLTLTFFTSRSISRGLSNLNVAAEEMGNGNFDRVLVVESQDEIGQLTHAVNKMGSLLKKTQQDLERRVEERTTELVKVANENAMLYIESKNAVKMRDDFLSIASHEIRTPLTALVLQLQRIVRQIKATPEKFEPKGFEDQIQNAIFLSKRLSLLQEELMSLTQIQAGKLELRKQSMDLMPVVSDIVTQLKEEGTRAGVTINFSKKEEVWGNFDSMKISQVVTNLISNALKYGAGKPIQVILEQDKNNAVIKVIDQGMGIPLDEQKKIFERFERVNKDENISGLGLGLYIAKQIVEAHRGSITVESNHNQGAIFSVFLPLV